MSENNKKKIALFQHHPECSEDCCNGIIMSLETNYTIQTFSPAEISAEFLKEFNMVVFPGGIGDASSYDEFFRYKSQKAVVDYVEGGGRYLGICMGAYWAGGHYFDLMKDVDCQQYIKRDSADIKRSYATTASCTWEGNYQDMFFYDGTVFVGDNTKFDTIATYQNNEPMAIIQNNIGLIGCHPESLHYWYTEPYKYLKDRWHNYTHHKLLENFVDRLMEN